MKRRSAHILILVAILLATLAGAAIAQDEDLTLEGVSARLEALISHVATVIERVEAIEAQLAQPLLEDGTCIMHLNSSPMQRETITKYIDKFDEEPGSMTIRSIYHHDDTGRTLILFDEIYPDRAVFEVWEGCTFTGSTHWLGE